MSSYGNISVGKQKHYILYAEDINHNRFYISNTNPILWSPIVEESKSYLSSKNAEFDIVGNYDNYNMIKQMLECNYIDKVFLAEVTNDNESGRLELL